MSVIGLVNQAVAWYAASAVLAFLFAMRKPLSGAIAGIGGAVASAMLVVAGGAALLMPERIHGGMLQFLHLTIRVGGVNALWLLAIGLSALPVSLFNISWHRHPQVKAIGPLVNLLLAAATCAVVVTNIGSLVVMAEIMALCAAFLHFGLAAVEGLLLLGGENATDGLVMLQAGGFQLLLQGVLFGLWQLAQVLLGDLARVVLVLAHQLAQLLALFGAEVEALERAAATVFAVHRLVAGGGTVLRHGQGEGRQAGGQDQGGEGLAHAVSPCL